VGRGLGELLTLPRVRVLPVGDDPLRGRRDHRRIREETRDRGGAARELRGDRGVIDDAVDRYRPGVSFGAAWKDRVVERSVERAAASHRDRRTYNSISLRALRPATRTVQAALELSHEGDTSLTVQQVIDRADVSLQTFYRHFPGKDDLMLAVIEEEVAQGAETYRKKALRLDDPTARVEAVVKGPFARSERSRLIPREHLRLLDTRARDVWAADAPCRNLLSEMISAAQDVGRFSGVDADDEADMITTLVLSRYHNLVLGAGRRSFAQEGAHIWAFCLAALSRGRPS
jgi:TetR/AcrR family transcriptional regulator